MQKYACAPSDCINTPTTKTYYIINSIPCLRGGSFPSSFNLGANDQPELNT